MILCIPTIVLGDAGAGLAVIGIGLALGILVRLCIPRERRLQVGRRIFRPVCGTFGVIGLATSVAMFVPALTILGFLGRQAWSTAQQNRPFMGQDIILGAAGTLIGYVLLCVSVAVGTTGIVLVAMAIRGPKEEQRLENLYGGNTKGTNARLVRFVLKPARHARNVAVAGNFSHWEPVAMQKEADGTFAVSVALEPGTHEYKFIVDEKWMVDVNNKEWLVNSLGTLNSVVHVR